MFFDSILIIIFQPLLGLIFIFLPPLLFDFFSENLKSFRIKIFLFSFLADVIFIKPFGFFLLLTSICFLFIYFLNKVIPFENFWQIFIFILIFNFIFNALFLFLENNKIIFALLLRITIFNLIFQLCYFLFKNLFFYDRRRFNFPTIR
ncbi:MAG: hypothetical protein KatS3mg093_367 [Candidatus Parcubacteria bacterium]|nr:MAG: hypothetical protein KatS3mg093_367 [Candidatus Parcubacteria bacterium]